MWFLPACLQTLVGSSGLEPPTSRLSGVCSNQLSYDPISFALPIGLTPFWGRFLGDIGGDEESRTPDPLLARQVLYQLSYTPESFEGLWKLNR